MTDELTTVQIDIETREILRGLAVEDYRSMAAELSSWSIRSVLAATLLPSPSSHC